MREFTVHSGMGLGIWNRNFARKLPDGTRQSWGQRVEEVVEGNLALHPVRPGVAPLSLDETRRTLELMRAGVLATSGRHLQQGDAEQPQKWGEVFTNCATACFSFMSFYLLMKGSGVGRLYDHAVCPVNWRYMPAVRLVLSPQHADAGKIEAQIPEHLRQHVYPSVEAARTPARITVHEVGDSAEGWAQAVMLLESGAHRRAGEAMILDFTPVRCEGSPIRGQQGRPASGPLPLMRAILEVAHMARTTNYSPWKQAMFVDHYFAQAVVVGGVRRSARIAVKTWDDGDLGELLEFARIKVEHDLWSANNSVGITDEFVELVTGPPVADDDHGGRMRQAQAVGVWDAILRSSWHFKQGEPGVVKVDGLSVRPLMPDQLPDHRWLHADFRRQLGFTAEVEAFVDYVMGRCGRHSTYAIVNPCGEVPLATWGGYCTIADVALAHARTPGEAMEAIALAGKMLVRVNQMKFVYAAEVARTNRIGVALTGIHEMAWRLWGLTWHDYDTVEAAPFWQFLAACRKNLVEVVNAYCDRIGAAHPHSYTCIKPSGTISKVLDCTEGAHLPAFAYYLRWVQFRFDEPSLQEHIDAGYPVRDVSRVYPHTAIVGFPTRTAIAELMGVHVTLAGEATMDSQYRWVQLLEEHWLGPKGVGGQVSYTLKYKRDVDYRAYVAAQWKWLGQVRACSVMPQEDTSAYIYLPEEAIDFDRYAALCAQIIRADEERVDQDRLQCDSGVCPIELPLAQ